MTNIIKKNGLSPQTESRVSPFSVIDRFFNDSFWDPFGTLAPDLFGSQRLSTASSFPKVDVSETDTEIRVRANVPGIDPEKLDIEVGDDYLALSGKIEHEEKDEKKGKVYRYEREYGEFRREFSLPARVDKDKIVAKAKNGVLTITMPKLEDEKRAKIKVEVEK